MALASRRLSRRRGRRPRTRWRSRRERRRGRHRRVARTPRPEPPRRRPTAAQRAARARCAAWTVATNAARILLCDETLGCVECNHDDDCPAAAARCLQGTCVGCRPALDGGTSDCPTAASTCWSTDDECHAPCSDASPCPTGSLCDKASGACVGCTRDSDCPSGVCSQTRRTCVECTDDTTCPASKPRCRVLTGTCEACTASSDCGHAAPVCDPTTFTCRVPADAGATDAASAAGGS